MMEKNVEFIVALLTVHRESTHPIVTTMNGHESCGSEVCTLSLHFDVPLVVS